MAGLRLVGVAALEEIFKPPAAVSAEIRAKDHDNQLGLLLFGEGEVFDDRWSIVAATARGTNSPPRDSRPATRCEQHP